MDNDSDGSFDSSVLLIIKTDLYIGGVIDNCRAISSLVFKCEQEQVTEVEHVPILLEFSQLSLQGDRWSLL